MNLSIALKNVLQRPPPAPMVSLQLQQGLSTGRCNQTGQVQLRQGLSTGGRGNSCRAAAAAPGRAAHAEEGVVGHDLRGPAVQEVVLRTAR